MNKVILSGNVCKDIEVRVIKGTDKIVIQNAIAVKRNYKNKQGVYDSDFINLVIFGHSAEFAKNYIRKGDLIEVCGRWQRNKKETQEGNRYYDECVVEEIKLLKHPQESQMTRNEETPSFDDDEDLPF